MKRSVSQSTAIAEAAHLLGNGAAGLFFPFPDFLNKFLTAHLFAAGLTFGGQFALYHHLRGDTGVVGAHLPQGIFAFHAVVAGQGVHNAMLQCVANMQAAGDIGWWNHNAVGVFIAAMSLGAK